MVASLTAKLTQAGAHDKADHDAIHNLNEQLSKESDERQKLGKLLNDKKDELATKTGELEILQGQLKETEKALGASQTLVKSQEKEIATVNAAKDAANGQVGRLEAVLEQAQKHAATLKTDLEAAQKTVERLNAENAEAAARITSLEWEIITVKAAEKNTQKELTQAKDNVQNVQNELNTTKEKLLETEESERKYMELYENQQAQAELHEKQDTLHAQQDTLHAQQDTKHIRKDELTADLLATSLNAKLKTSENAYNKLQNEHGILIQNTTEKVTQLERKLETTNKELTDAKEKLKNNAIQADKMAGELDEKLKKAQSTLTSVEGRLIKPAEHRKNERINIASVEYGGKAYTEDTDRAVYDRLYKMARENSAEVMSNTFFGGDPWVGIRKSFAVTYQVGGKGKLTLGYGYENATFRFNLEAKN